MIVSARKARRARSDAVTWVEVGALCGLPIAGYAQGIEGNRCRAGIGSANRQRSAHGSSPSRSRTRLTLTAQRESPMRRP